MFHNEILSQIKLFHLITQHYDLEAINGNAMYIYVIIKHWNLYEMLLLFDDI